MEEVKKNPKYDGMTISELESDVEKFHLSSREFQKEMFERLEYLRMTNRYKENLRYKTSSFWMYLEDRFTIRENTYRENVRAYSKFPEYTLEYGVGLVSKVNRVCGPMKVEKVMSEIRDMAANRKTPLSRGKMETIIKKHATPQIKKTITDWKAMYEAEKLAHDRTKEALKVAMKTVKERDEQIERLKVTAQKVTRIRKIFDEPTQRVASV